MAAPKDLPFARRFWLSLTNAPRIPDEIRRTWRQRFRDLKRGRNGDGRA